jgi:hypothetical protein
MVFDFPDDGRVSPDNCVVWKFPNRPTFLVMLPRLPILIAHTDGIGPDAVF